MSSNSFDEVMRKAIDLNVRYYSTLGRLAADYMRELVTVMAEPMKAAVNASAAPCAPPVTAPQSAQG